MRGEILGACPVCKGAGIIRRAVEYPNVEAELCCTHCKAGWSIAETIARIVARTRNEDRAQVA